MEKYIDNALIQGDLFSGICVMEYENATYRFNLDGVDAQVKMEVIKDLDDRKVVAFNFILPENQSLRFRLDLFIPEEAINAHIGLNGQELIGFFDKNVDIKDPEPLIKGSCNDPHKVSTLHPGEFQAINFAWENGDTIILAYYM
ncbi:MAG: hypothetical protein MJ153_00235 [Clostridia bacterium]|nr:hypothetical protein [Clostridia bacterium]